MKLIKEIAILIFAIIVFIPVVAFNFESDAISEIDNRELTENPFSKESMENGNGLKTNIENYVNDRIGFRDEMISAYTEMNDTVFHKMVHPSYTYGKEGYVFPAEFNMGVTYTDFHESFVDMIADIQKYCEDRNVPFVFVFEPAKPSVLTEYIPDGVNYDRTWVDEFCKALDEKNINYVDNTELLIEKTKEGEKVFNKKYDANHWNDLGAYYGTNAILERLKNEIPTIHVNKKSELEVSSEMQISLPVSKFEIRESVPLITLDLSGIDNLTSKYSDEIELDKQHRGFGYYRNNKRLKEGAPKSLVFQGSYMNNFGTKYFENSFGEYIHVHDYQNILNFQYYYNIFKPDCVVFEVAEYTLNDAYFNFERMKTFELNPRVSDVEAIADDVLKLSLDDEQVSVQRGESLTKIIWKNSGTYENLWLLLDDEYDMRKVEEGWEVTVLTEKYDRYKDNMNIVSYDGKTITKFI